MENIDEMNDFQLDMLAKSTLVPEILREIVFRYSELLESANSKIADLTCELEAAKEELENSYLVQMPDSLTALMELEERLA